MTVLVTPTCENCGSKKIHPLAADSSKAICQMCGKVTEIGATPSKPKLEESPKKPREKKKSNRGGDAGGRNRWSEDEDKLLIRICEETPAFTMKEAHVEYSQLKQEHEDWIYRSLRAVRSRITKLRLLGLIKYKNKPSRIIKCPNCGNEFKITR